MGRIATYLSLLLLLTSLSCRTSNVSYLEPQQQPEFENTAVIPMGKEKLWARVVSILLKNYFIINTIDRDSGLITLTYRGNPERYCDCGVTLITLNRMRGSDRYEFPNSREFAQFELVLNGALYDFDRAVDLEVHANILLEELSPASTRVTVSAQYDLSGKTTSPTWAGRTDEFIRVFGEGSRYLESPLTVYFKGSFHTGERKEIDGIICQPTGKFEQDLLNLLQRQ